jgi:4,5-DOPA dioxygenase extradiol
VFRAPGRAREETDVSTLFLSHGSPMHALQAGDAGTAWQKLAESLPRPRAILIASAHWETSLPMLTGRETLETIHDFSGFPVALYREKYDAPGAPDVARRALALLQSAGYTAAVNSCRGIDHGAWVPLKWMYPGCDIPVVQLSIQTELGPAHHLEIGASLSSLQDEGVLVIGSGHVTHNLRDWSLHAANGESLPYVQQFSDWLYETLARGDRETLVAYRERAPGAVRAHPTEEHFLPLFIALGAAGNGALARRVYASIEAGALAMDAYVFDSVRGASVS